MNKEQSIVEWSGSIVNGKKLVSEIKVDGKLFVPVKDNSYISFDGRIWKPKKNIVSTNLGKTYNKKSKYNMQNHFLKWPTSKNIDFCFTMNDYFNETGAYRTRPKRYDHYLRSLDDDGFLESIVTPGSQTQYFVCKKFNRKNIREVEKK